MRLPVLTATDGEPWEAELVVALDSSDLGVTIVRRCVDVIDLLAVALSGQARAALVSAGLRRFDADVVDRLLAAEVVPVGVFARADTEVEDRLRAMGVLHVVASDASAEVIASVVEQAISAAGDESATARVLRGFADPAGSTAATGGPPPTDVAMEDAASRRGSVVAVWGPTGAPGRSTVALGLADELSRLGSQALLIDADVYGGVVAPTLGLLDESPGLAAACRQAGQSRLDRADLATLCWQISPTMRVLTGIPRADRWPELRAAAVENIIGAARRLADFCVVDLGFCLETDEELSYDTLAPRRNGMTLAMLDAADLVIAVGSADPIGMQRLIRGLAELRDAEVSAPVWVVLNRMRATAVPGDPGRELAAALERFAGRAPAALLPFDSPAVDAALSVGKTLAETRPTGALRRALAELAAAVAGVPARPSRRHGRR